MIREQSQTVSYVLSHLILEAIEGLFIEVMFIPVLQRQDIQRDCRVQHHLLISSLVSYLLFSAPLATGLVECCKQVWGSGVLSLGSGPAPLINSSVTPRFSYLTSQSLSFLICKMGIFTELISQGCKGNQHSFSIS